MKRLETNLAGGVFGKPMTASTRRLLPKNKAEASPAFNWTDCWQEIGRLRRDLHRLMERMRDLAPGNVAVRSNVQQVKELALNFAGDVTGVNLLDMRKKCRKNDVAWARHIAMSLTREFTGAGLVEITRAFGHFDHNTVVYAMKKVRNEPAPKYRAQVEEVRALLRNALIAQPLAAVPARSPRGAKLKRVKEEKVS